MADYEHPADILGTAPSKDITAGVDAGIEKLGMRNFILSLTLDMQHHHWHDWRVYAQTLDRIATAIVNGKVKVEP